VLSLALLSAGDSALAVPPVPFVIPQSADGYDMPLLPGSTHAVGLDNDPAVDPVDDFGHAIGEALRVQQQADGERCRAGATEAASASAQTRYAWAAACRYVRR
jgi:hypothetical protein